VDLEPDAFALRIEGFQLIVHIAFIPI